MINDLASLTLYLISKIGKKIKVTRPGYEKSKLLGSLDNWEPGQLSRILQIPAKNILRVDWINLVKLK